MPLKRFFWKKKKSFVKVYQKTFIKKARYNIKSFDDERYVHTLYNNYLFPKFISVHYHFGPQANESNETIFNYYKNLILTNNGFNKDNL